MERDKEIEEENRSLLVVILHTSSECETVKLLRIVVVKFLFCFSTSLKKVLPHGKLSGEVVAMKRERS